jgi:peptide-methionine (S)-S-oxide reductase
LIFLPSGTIHSFAFEWKGQSGFQSKTFYANDDQKQIALAYIDQLNRAKAFPGPTVTQVVPFRAFYPAEGRHRNFLARNPTHPYIV